MNDREYLKEILFEAVEIISMLNELIKKETMIGVDYTGVYEDLKWNKMILRNRLEALDEAESNWMSAKEYLEKLEE
ncbi:MAG: hypothetical protein J6Y78_11225 [Paludibacteraceae bacterium]|nr:hypothetical protein [Paludibacteraceae bacterium]